MNFSMSSMTDLVFLLLICNAFWTLRGVRRRAASFPEPAASDLQMLSLGLTLSLCVLLTSGMTSSVTYAEYFWWFLALPVCLQRAAANVEKDLIIDEQERQRHRLRENLEDALPG